MKQRGVLLLAAISFLVAGTLLSAGSASATTQAIVQVQYLQQFFAGSTFRFNTVIGTATVTNTSTPTPAVVWPAGITAGTYNYPFTPIYFSNTPTGYGYLSWYAAAAALSKGHPGVAVLTANGGASVVLPAQAAGTVNGSPYTTKCFASIPPAMPGNNGTLTTLPNQCFPKYGMIERRPGPKGFGGQARFILRNDFFGYTLMGLPSGTSMFNVKGVPTPQLTGVEFIGNYGIISTGTRTNQNLGTPMDVMAFSTTAPHTTGMVRMVQPDFATSINFTGTHNLNPANLTGVISLAQPQLNQVYSRDVAGTFLGRSPSFARMNVVIATFLPEPGTALLLGCGVLGLAVFAALRRR